MGSFVENPVVSLGLTVMLVMQLVKVAKPIVLNRLMPLSVASVLSGVVVQYVLVLVLYGVYAFPGLIGFATNDDMSDEDGARGARIVGFAEFLSLNVTLTSLYACGLLAMVVACFCLVGTWVHDLSHVAAGAMEYLQTDAFGRPVIDLRLKTVLK